MCECYCDCERELTETVERVQGRCTACADDDEHHWDELA